MSNLSPIELVIKVITDTTPVNKLNDSLKTVQQTTEAGTRATRKSAEAAQLAGSRFGGWNDALSRFQRQSWAAQAGMTYMKTAGRSLLGVSNQLKAVATDLTDKWGEFELALVRSAGAVGIVDRTSALFGDLKEGIYDARRELGFFESSEIASALYKWGAAMGITIKTAADLKTNMSAVKAIMKVAAINFEDFETVMLGVTSALNTFNLPVKKAADVAALFSYAAMGSAASVSDLVTSMKYVGPIAKNMGESVSSVFDLLMSLSDAGIKGSQAGTSLRRTYSMLIKPTKAVKAGLVGIFGSQGKVNKALYTAKGGFKGLANMAWQVAKATKGMTNEQRLSVVSQIAQQTNMPALISLVDKYSTAQANGAKSLDKAQDMQKKANEALRAQWELLQGTWTGTVNQLKGAVEPVLLSIGETLAKKFTPAVKDAAKWVKEVAEPWVKANPDLIAAAATVAAITAALTGLSGAFLLVSGTIGNVGISAVLGFVKVIAILASPLLMLARVIIPGLITAIGAISTPVLVVAAIIAAAVAAYATNFLGFRDAVNSVVNWLVQTLPGAINTALTAIGSVVSAVISPITDKLPTIIAFLTGIIEKLSAAWLPVLAHIGEVAGEVFGNIATVIGEVAASVFEHVGPLVDELSKLGAVIYEFIGPAWNFLVTVVGAVLGFVIKAVTEFAAAIAPIVGGFVDFILRAFGVLAEGVIRTVGTFVNLVIDTIKGFVTVIRGIIEVFTGLLTGNWDKVWKGLGTTVGGFVDLAKGLINAFIEGIKTVINAGLHAVFAIFEFIFGQAPGSIFKAVQDGIGRVGKAISDFAGSVAGFFTGLPGKMVDIGKSIVEGLWNGIKSLAGWIADKVSALVKDIIPGPIRDALGIKSPSRVMAAIGVNVMEGLAKGIEQTTTARDAMYAQAASIVSAANFAADGVGVASANFGGTFNSSTRTEARRELIIKHEITSPDGSLSNVDINSLYDMLNSDSREMVRAIERMSSVD